MCWTSREPARHSHEIALACVSRVAARFPTFEKYNHEWLNALEIEDRALNNRSHPFPNATVIPRAEAERIIANFPKLLADSPLRIQPLGTDLDVAPDQSSLRSVSEASLPSWYDPSQKAGVWKFSRLIFWNQFLMFEWQTREEQLR